LNGRACVALLSASLRLIVVLNEKLLEVMGDDATQERAFAHANDVLKNAVGDISDISDIIHIPGAGEKSTSKT
jgi:cell division protein FtsZ